MRELEEPQVGHHRGIGVPVWNVGRSEERRPADFCFVLPRREGGSPSEEQSTNPAILKPNALLMARVIGEDQGS
jgi:hypothetical protein